jgi:hypothetical protein
MCVFIIKISLILLFLYKHLILISKKIKCTAAIILYTDNQTQQQMIDNQIQQ